MSDILERAYQIHARACLNWPNNPDWGNRVARPFGTPDTMPRHRWRVSRDVMQRLVEAIPPYMVSEFAPNPKSAFGAERRLFGWVLDIDRDAPPDTLSLEIEQ